MATAQVAALASHAVQLPGGALALTAAVTGLDAKSLQASFLGVCTHMLPEGLWTPSTPSGLAARNANV